MLALVLALLLQPPGPPPGPPPGSPQMRKQVGERIRVMRIARLTEALQLDEAQAQRFFPILTKYDQKLQPIHQMQADLTRQLAQEASLPRPNEQKINAAIEELLRLRQQAQAIETERIREVRKVLTPVQQARLVLALPKIERQLWRQVRRAMGQPEED
jgi:Spy/CpxP family protein refolding chaperone